ncbi:ParB/RepB/Spo0J family partition protein [Actinomadura opuntiae]|uniref:ParB/RepB/Spo0J family partition protein n=1 Tax=Actinomadura sp. OS1-43 TaxID=604315 RepID=UPI00255AED50|nr:ParB/RepB/Spo0J family partition protein [Actinomadura sp. OS1-43]MDL4820292.1 ParB/RepB/Spo0J family partition protein [Actinomadura sp. OS1-43]
MEHSILAEPAGSGERREDQGRAGGGAGEPAAAVHSVPVTALLSADSPRLAGEDRDHTLRLVEAGRGVPPILVHRATMRVVDGMHRLRAAILRGDETIDVVYFDGDADEAFVRAVEENVAHGLPLSRADRRAAAARIMASHPRLSDRAIAARTGLSAKSVAEVRRSSAAVPRSNERLGADGRVRPLNSAEGRLAAARAMTQRPDAPLREIARAAGVSLSTAHDVRKRLSRQQNPVPERYAGPPARPRTGGAAPGRAGGAGRADRQRDHGAILRTLMKDPSLRNTDTGRQLLMLLRARVIAPGDWADLLDSVPPHCREAVAELARHCATSWHRLADELDRR